MDPRFFSINLWSAHFAALSPPQITTRLASLADFFLLFPPNAEPGPRLRQAIEDVEAQFLITNYSPFTGENGKI